MVSLYSLVTIETAGHEDRDMTVGNPHFTFSFFKLNCFNELKSFHGKLATGKANFLCSLFLFYINMQDDVSNCYKPNVITDRKAITSELNW